MFKKSLLALTLLTVAGAASAEVFTTDVQNQTFTGIAGKASGVDGVSPFVFDKFDESLGTLTNVYFRSTVIIDGGLIGADNFTNEVVSGSGHIGASVTIGDLTNDDVSLLDDEFKPLFSTVDRVRSANFELAADPTESLGGSGADTVVMAGDYHEVITGFSAIAQAFLSQFIGAGDTFSINFDSNSEVYVEADGAQNTFQTAVIDLGLELVYEYEVIEDSGDDNISDVSAPFGVAALGLSLMGFGAARRRTK